MKKLLYPIVLVISFLTFSCRKTNEENALAKSFLQNSELSIFKNEIEMVRDDYQKLDSVYSFSSDFNQWYGSPLWEHSHLVKNKEISILFIPYSKPAENFVSAFLVATVDKTFPDSVVYEIHRLKAYKEKKAEYSRYLNRAKVEWLFIFFDKKIFGYSD